ncbi:hypothetical protein PVAND_010807 [Polypedilum vanderplanki]|uniref:DUF229 domain containing protein n=1 Tax=Polypedilum vanderplanki TaxID=319348 RepID=A0A9J6CHE1_POLVA|nr:hypothetical protein PVAND_010807 [Polypedilum vanderplanki]
MFPKGVKRRNVILVFAIIAVYFLVNFIHQGRDVGDSKEKIILIEESIRSFTNQGRCKIPNIPYDSPDMMKFIKDEEPINCGNDEDWVHCNVSFCIIKKRIVDKKGGFISCEFQDIMRNGDNSFQYGNAVRSTNKYMLQNSDFVRIKCKAADGSKWSGTGIGIRKDVEIIKRHKVADGLMNVLIFGFDSISRNSFIRKLPKAYHYLTNELNADVLKGFNIVGDGTPQALIPLLTGYTELELPEARKRKFSSNYVDVYPFIWKKYQSAGYVTAFNEDQPKIGTFSYRLKGFNQTPTDHYQRLYYLAIESDLYKSKKYCVGSRPKHQVMFDYTYDFLQRYNNTKNPTFAFSFHAELSHDSINLVGVIDDDLTNWLKKLHSSFLLNNTLMIFMSDHGNRFMETRNTLHGKLEERLPFFSFIFPETFKSKYYAQYKIFQSNLQNLVTPFDAHETLEDFLHLQLYNRHKAQEHARALSLFKKIPKDRTCADAYIEAHWCSCLSWSSLNDTKSSEEILRATNAVLDTINKFTQDYRKICMKLTLKEVVWSAKLIPQKSLLNFKSNLDTDGFLADLTANTKVTNEMYQVKIITNPSEAIYESTVLYDFTNNVFRVKISDISRTNKYGDQARCIMDENPELRKFCYCSENY